jgi:IS5 family transposase
MIRKSLNDLVNVEDWPNNLYDGLTLSLSISGAEAITKVVVSEENVDRDYHDYKGSAVIRIAGSSNAHLTVSEIKRKRRRSSIESVIGHLKRDYRLDGCFLHGRVGDWHEFGEKCFEIQHP